MPVSVQRSMTSQAEPSPRPSVGARGAKTAAKAVSVPTGSSARLGTKVIASSNIRTSLKSAPRGTTRAQEASSTTASGSLPSEAPTDSTTQLIPRAPPGPSRNNVLANLRHKRPAKAAAQAAADAAAEAALEWAEQDSTLQEAALHKEEVNQDEDSFKNLDDMGAPETTQGWTPLSGAASSSEPQVTSRSSVKLPNGPRKKGARRRRGKETTITMAFNFSTESRRSSRRRVASDASQDRIGGRPRASSGNGASLTRPEKLSRPAASANPIGPSISETAAEGDEGDDESAAELPEEQVVEEDEEEEKALAQHVVDWVTKDVPEKAGPSSPVADHEESSPKAASSVSAAGGRQLGHWPSPLMGERPRLQNGEAAATQQRVAGSGPASASHSQPGSRRHSRRGPPLERPKEDDASSASAASACAQDDELPSHSTVERCPSTSIIRTRPSHVYRNEVSESPVRHVYFSAETPVEVVQFSVEDVQQTPSTTRGPRRVFGGELQASPMPVAPTGTAPCGGTSASPPTAVASSAALLGATQRSRVATGHIPGGQPGFSRSADRLPNVQPASSFSPGRRPGGPGRLGIRDLVPADATS